MPSSAKRNIHSVDLTGKEIDHLCNVLTIDADTIEAMMEDKPANKSDATLVADLKASLALIQKLANSKVTGVEAG